MMADAPKGPEGLHKIVGRLLSRVAERRSGYDVSEIAKGSVYLYGRPEFNRPKGRGVTNAV